LDDKRKEKENKRIRLGPGLGLVHPVPDPQATTRSKMERVGSDPRSGRVGRVPPDSDANEGAKCAACVVHMRRTCGAHDAMRAAGKLSAPTPCTRGNF
jgi:hypothetical protein